MMPPYLNPLSEIVCQLSKIQSDLIHGLCRKVPAHVVAQDLGRLGSLVQALMLT